MSFFKYQAIETKTRTTSGVAARVAISDKTGMLLSLVEAASASLFLPPIRKF